MSPEAWPGPEPLVAFLPIPPQACAPKMRGQAPPSSTKPLPVQQASRLSDLEGPGPQGTDTGSNNNSGLWGRPPTPATQWPQEHPPWGSPPCSCRCGLGLPPHPPPPCPPVPPPHQARGGGAQTLKQTAREVSGFQDEEGRSRLGCGQMGNTLLFHNINVFIHLFYN